MLLNLNGCDFNVQTTEWDEVSFRHVRGLLLITLCDGDRINCIILNEEEVLLGVESYDWPDYIPTEDEVLAKYLDS